MNTLTKTVQNRFIKRKRPPQPKLTPLQRGSYYYTMFFGAFGTFLPFYNLYFRQELGFSGRQIGILSLFFPLMTILVAMPLSALADRYSRRITILMSTMTGFILLLIFVAGRLQQFALWVGFMFCLSVFFGPIMPLGDSLIARMSLRHKVNYGTMRLWGSLSFAVCAISYGALWDHFSADATFMVTGIALLPALGFASLLEESPPMCVRPIKGPIRELLHDRGLVSLLLASLLVGAGLRLSLIFDGIYMNALGGAQFWVGLMFGVGALTELPTMQYSAWLIQRLNGPRTLILSYCLMMLAFMGYVLAWRPGVLVLMTAVKGLGFGLFIVSTIRLTSERVEEHQSSTVQSMVSASAFGIAPLLAALVGGEVYDRIGIKAIFLCSSLLIGSAALLLIIAANRGGFFESSHESLRRKPGFYRRGR